MGNIQWNRIHNEESFLTDYSNELFSMIFGNFFIQYVHINDMNKRIKKCYSLLQNCIYKNCCVGSNLS